MGEVREKRKLGLWIAAALFLLAAIIVVALRITTVTVSGSTRYTPEQMEEYLFQDTWDRNPLVCYLKDRLQPHRQIPFVDDYRLVFHGPTSLEVIVYEKSVVGYVSCMSSYMYFDRDGIVVESSTKRLEGVPEITGLKFGHLILHHPLPVEDQSVFQDIMTLTQQLELYEVEVDRIAYNAEKEATLYIGQMEVSLGKGNNMDSKISVLSDILKSQPQLAQMDGVIELDNYSEDGIGGGITFRKRENPRKNPFFGY